MTWLDDYDADEGPSFDEAQDAFRANPCIETATAYEREAEAYHDDEMIGDDTFKAAWDEVAAWAEKEDDRQ